MHTKTLLIRGGLVPDLDQRRLEEKDIVVRDGRIVTVADPGSVTTSGDEVEVLDASNSIVIPGLVNCHTHSYGTLGRHFASGLPLEPWMMYSWAITGGRTREEAYLSALIQGVEALMTGTTTVLDHLGGPVELSAEAARAYGDLGLRAAVAPMISDIPLHRTVGLGDDVWQPEHAAGLAMLQPPTATELLDETKSLHETWDGAADGLISILIGPSAPQRCTPELLDGCAQLSQELGTRVHTHLLETRAQSVHPRAGIDTLASTGLLTERLIGAHAVWTTSDDLARLGGAGASLVHNPQSNLQLGSGVAQLSEWRERGVRRTLGTDGTNCGGSMDMLSSMRLASLLHRPGLADEKKWEGPWSILGMATKNGAEALGLSDLGHVAEGQIADLAVFSMAGTPYFATPDKLHALILSSLSSLATHVIVNGKIVVQDGIVGTVDLVELEQRARAASEVIFERNAERVQEVSVKQQDVLTAHSRSIAPSRPFIPFIS